MIIRIVRPSHQMTGECRYPRLAVPSDIGRLTAGADLEHTWPPPGCEIVPVGHPGFWGLVCGTPPTEPGHWYVTTLATFADELDATVEQVLSQAGRTFSGWITAFVNLAGQWPVIFEVGKGDFVRWESSTVRGWLGGGVEQFQWKMDWGVPGADPDWSEAEALANAQLLAGVIGGAWQSDSLDDLYPADLKFLEVGFTQKTQTDATGSDGTGGNLEQDYPTQWWAYPGGSPVSGASASISLPFEVACCVTLDTDHRGPSGRGRYYLPAPATNAMAAGGVFSASMLNAVLTFAKDVANNGASAMDVVPVVVSRRRLILNEIKVIEVGKVPDSQRRRRRSQDEARAPITL
jgi:hypothetical protein